MVEKVKVKTDVERKRVELTLKRENIPVNDDTIRAFAAGLKVKVIGPTYLSGMTEIVWPYPYETRKQKV